MRFMKSIKCYNKNKLLKLYTVILGDFRNALGKTKVKVLSEIYEFYKDYSNVISLCTLKELRFLDKCIKEKVFKNIEGYDFEIRNLLSKFLIICEGEFFVVPEEIFFSIKDVINNYVLEDVNRLDKINEILVAFVKIYGFIEVCIAINACNIFLKIGEEEILNHIFNNLCFRFYVEIVNGKVFMLDENTFYFVYRDYSYLIDKLKLLKSCNCVFNMANIEFQSYKSIFYNDFDLSKESVKSLFDNLKYFEISDSIIQEILKSVLLNEDRKNIKSMIGGKIDLKVLDSAMDDMPSGVLNGLSLNEFKKLKMESFEIYYMKSKECVSQINGCLDYEDSRLFLKLYYAVLDFTNDRYKIKPNYNVFNSNYNISDLSLIVETFWIYKEIIIEEFCYINPFKLQDFELELVLDFKKSVRDVFIIMEYFENYAAFMSLDNVYMVKGIKRNICEIFFYNDLPVGVYATILPFKGKLVFDGIALQLQINMNLNFYNMLDNVYRSLDRCYYL